MEEEWRDVEGYEGLYQVSSLGRIKRLSGVVSFVSRWGTVSIRKIKEKILKNYYTGDGYKHTVLTKNRISQGYMVARLVAGAFIPNPENKPTVNHIDGNKANNTVLNLEWNTYSENNQHRYDTGLMKPQTGEAHWAWGTHLSEETRKKLRIATAGENNPMYGKHHTEETKEKIRQKHIGIVVSGETKEKIRKKRKERIYTQETRDKISKALKGRTITEEARIKISESQRKRLAAIRAAQTQ